MLLFINTYECYSSYLRHGKLPSFKRAHTVIQMLGWSYIWREDCGREAEEMFAGLGACTCSYFYPDDRHLIYAGTFQSAKFNSNVTLESCPQKVCKSERAKTDPVLRELCMYLQISLPLRTILQESFVIVHSFSWNTHVFQATRATPGTSSPITTSSR